MIKYESHKRRTATLPHARAAPLPQQHWLITLLCFIFYLWCVWGGGGGLFVLNQHECGAVHRVHILVFPSYTLPTPTLLLRASLQPPAFTSVACPLQPSACLAGYNRHVLLEGEPCKKAMGETSNTTATDMLASLLRSSSSLIPMQ